MGAFGEVIGEVASGDIEHVTISDTIVGEIGQVGSVGQVNGGGGSSHSNEEVIDINDPRLTSEVTTDDITADAYESLPPAPSGLWRAKLRQKDVKDAKGNMVKVRGASFPKMNNGELFLVTNVEAELIDNSGKFSGTKVAEYWIKTLVDARRGTSSASTLATKLGAKLPPRSTHADRMGALQKALAGEPECLIELEWEASCQLCQQQAQKKGEKSPRPYLYGMNRFPMTAKGLEHDPAVQCPTCNSVNRAQLRIIRYLALNEGKPTRGL